MDDIREYEQLETCELASQLRKLIEATLQGAAMTESPGRLDDEIGYMRLELLQRFADRRGVKISTTSFGPFELLHNRKFRRGSYEALTYPKMFHSDFGDHPFYFRDEQGRAALFVSHLYYVDAAKCEAFSSMYNLKFEASDFPSWHIPGSTTTCIFSSGA